MHWRPFVLVITIGTASAAAQAPEPSPAVGEATVTEGSVTGTPDPVLSSRESVMKFFAAAQFETQVQQIQQLMMGQVVENMDRKLEQNEELPADRKRALRETFLTEVEGIRRAYPISEMLDDMVPVYQRHLTEEDLAAITAFYASPVGQKMLSRSGAMMQEAIAIIMPKMQARMEAVMAEVRQRMDERMKEPDARQEP